MLPDRKQRLQTDLKNGNFTGRRLPISFVVKKVYTKKDYSFRRHLIEENGGKELKTVSITEVTAISCKILPGALETLNSL